MATDAELATQPLLLLDVGGGSTEFIVGRGARKHFAHSFPLGTVRLLEKFPPSDPPTPAEFAACRDWLKQFLHHEVRPQLEPALSQERGPIQLVGTGGTTPVASAPVLTAQTAAQTWKHGQSISFTLASNTFTDPQNSKLTFSAKLSTGAALPSWLTFNAATGTFTASGR